LNIMPSEQASVFSQLHPRIQSSLKAIPRHSKYYVALSGGLDSMILLSAFVSYLKSQSSPCTVEAIHVHHGLSEYANDWADHCQQECARLGVHCYVERVGVVNKGQGLEAAARDARYGVFERYLAGGGVLLQGHHQNDQAETVLMKMLRGAGVEGLSGMPLTRALSRGYLYRPWLKIPRAILSAEALKCNIEWVEDESNTDTRFDRNYMRHQVMPVLQARWPQCLNELSRVSAKAQETKEFLTGWCESNIVDLFADRYSDGKALCLVALANHSAVEQRLLLRHWFDLNSLEHPPEASFNRIWTELISVKDDAQPEVRWGQQLIRRFDNCLFLLLAEQLADMPYCVGVDLEGAVFPIKCEVPGVQLAIEMLDAVSGGLDGVCLRRPALGVHVSLRSRVGGEVIYLKEGVGSALKKLYQTEKILPWERSKTPLLYYDDCLVASLAGFVAHTYVPVIGDSMLRLRHLK
jgi:tRNA(Ile)-lysidine synthase